jgi:uncharacterized protein with HEPN domain
MSSDGSKRSPLDIVGFAQLHLGRILRWTMNDTEASYLANDERQAAVERCFIAIGEAVSDLSRMVDLAALDPAGPWNEAVRFRHFLAHRYNEGTSHADVFKTVRADLPILEAALARVESALLKQ